MGSVTKETEITVKATNTGFRPMEFDNLHQFGVVYEMHLDQVSHERIVYGFLDWLSDLGGLVSALMAAFAVILRIFMYQALDFHMVERLFSR